MAAETARNEEEAAARLPLEEKRNAEKAESKIQKRKEKMEYWRQMEQWKIERDAVVVDIYRHTFLRTAPQLTPAPPPSPTAPPRPIQNIRIPTLYSIRGCSDPEKLDAVPATTTVDKITATLSVPLSSIDFLILMILFTVSIMIPHIGFWAVVCSLAVKLFI